MWQDIWNLQKRLNVRGISLHSWAVVTNTIPRFLSCAKKAKISLFTAWPFH